MILNITIKKDGVKHEFLIKTNRRKLTEKLVNRIKWRIGNILLIEPEKIEKKDNNDFKQIILKYDHIDRFTDHILLRSKTDTKVIQPHDKLRLHEITVNV